MRTLSEFLIGLLLCTALPAFAGMGGISGKVVYSKHGTVRVHTLGSEEYVEIGKGDFARWGPDGQRVAIKDDATVYVVNADGTGKVVLTRDAGGGNNNPLEFHPNGKDVLYINDDRIMAVNIESGEKRVLMDFVDCTGEIGMAREKNRVVCRDGHILRAIDLDTRKHTVYHKDNCSAGISPDGNYVMMNDNGDNFSRNHGSVFIRELNKSTTSSKKYLKVSNEVLPGENTGDNHHWSNHPDWITFEGDNDREGVPFMMNIATKKGYAMVNTRGTRYPDLWVAPE